MFQVSGSLDLSTVSHDPRREVRFSASGRPDLRIPVQKDGTFSLMLAPNSYTVSVVGTPSDEQVETSTVL